MGVDISGKNPIIRSPKHDYPNWNEISDKEKDEWFEMDEKWHNENPGDYFRSNWWGWRPIVMLCEFANDDKELGFDLINWGSNDGAGLDNQEDCNKLADALEELISTQTELEEDADTIYLNLGSWTSMDGKFLGEEINKELNEYYEYGTILYGSVVMEDGTLAQPSHSAPLRHVNKFISFLRECGGFEIW
jgi:hypothetical protein